jgi:hypothetical protein
MSHPLHVDLQLCNFKNIFFSYASKDCVAFRSFRACFETARACSLRLYAAPTRRVGGTRSCFLKGNNFACWLTEKQQKA